MRISALQSQTIWSLMTLRIRGSEFRWIRCRGSILSACNENREEEKVNHMIQPKRKHLRDNGHRILCDYIGKQNRSDGFRRDFINVIVEFVEFLFFDLLAGVFTTLFHLWSSPLDVNDNNLLVTSDQMDIAFAS